MYSYGRTNVSEDINTVFEESRDIGRTFLSTYQQNDTWQVCSDQFESALPKATRLS